MHRLLLIFTLLLSCVGFSQSITGKGKCLDRNGKPVDNVRIYCGESIEGVVYSDIKGEYQFSFTRPDTVQIIYRIGESEMTKRQFIRSGVNTFSEVRFKFQNQEEVVFSKRVEDPFEIPKLPYFDVQNIPLNSIERSLIYTTAATSNNELTTNYNVRGGSYDENLVYVNGFNVYRPFLTRSGQQEGMSFLHSSLVQSIRFSAGGFDARYGDKLSSVLDIEYKTPDSLRGSLVTSLLGVEAHVEQEVNRRFNYLVGARYRSNGYLLNSLPTKGAYNPVFWDAQLLTNYNINENVVWSLLGHFSSNNYRFAPQTQRTDFGTANEAYSFVVYFDGQEQTRFLTMMGGTSIKWKASKKTNLDFYATAFNTNEREYFDIEGQYFINELETDPSKEEFGDSIATLGIGSFLNHARNRLNATILNVYHHGDHTFRNGISSSDSSRYQSHKLKWGVNFQSDDFYDVLSEWRVIDSAGFSLPQSGTGEIELFETIKGQLNLKSQRYTSFVQLNSTWSNRQVNRFVELTKTYREGDKKVEKYFSDTVRQSVSKWLMSVGARSGYTTANQEFYITPRASVTYYPRTYMVHKGKVVRRFVSLRLASGLYYQPPFYREFRTFDGGLNLDVKAQKSWHIVGGSDVYFSLWNRERPFKFTAEAYYKYLWDVNSYEIDNVRTRYYANNNARAYAYGLDLNVNGQFIEGIESFFKVGFLSTKEDVIGDFYYEYYNAAGEKIQFGVTDLTPVDSVRVEPGFIPRPTDQLLNFGALIQDRMPKFESFTVQVGIQFGTRLPYGPPDFVRYKDTLRQKSYFRVDLGMSYDFLYNKRDKNTFLSRNFDDAILSFEVFNLLGINNVLSNQWIQDVEGRFYAIPNFLTQRRFNVKLILRF